MRQVSDIGSGFGRPSSTGSVTRLSRNCCQAANLLPTPPLQVPQVAWRGRPGRAPTSRGNSQSVIRHRPNVFCVTDSAGSDSAAPSRLDSSPRRDRHLRL